MTYELARRRCMDSAPIRRPSDTFPLGSTESSRDDSPVYNLKLILGDTLWVKCAVFVRLQHAAPLFAGSFRYNIRLVLKLTSCFSQSIYDTPRPASVCHIVFFCRFTVLVTHRTHFQLKTHVFANPSHRRLSSSLWTASIDYYKLPGPCLLSK